MGRDGHVIWIEWWHAPPDLDQPGCGGPTWSLIRDWGRAVWAATIASPWPDLFRDSWAMVPPRGARPFPRQPFQAATRAHGQSQFPSGNCLAGLGLVGPQGPRAIRVFARMPPTRGVCCHAPVCSGGHAVAKRPRVGFFRCPFTPGPGRPSWVVWCWARPLFPSHSLLPLSQGARLANWRTVGCDQPTEHCPPATVQAGDVTARGLASGWPLAGVVVSATREPTPKWEGPSAWFIWSWRSLTRNLSCAT